MHVVIDRIRANIASDEGNISVESVLWFPVYMLVISLVFDATMLMMGQTQLWSVASDASRMVASKTRLITSM